MKSENRPFRVSRRVVWNAFTKFPKGHHREALVFLYFETGPVTTWTGLFQAPIVDVARFTCLDVQEVRQAIANLERWKMIVYDPDRQIVCVKGLLLRQARYSPNEKQVQGIIRHVDEMPEDSPAVRAFIQEHVNTPELSEHFEVMYGVSDDVSNRVSDRVSMRSKKLEVRSEKEELRSEEVKSESVIPQKNCGTTTRSKPFFSTSGSTSTPATEPKVNSSPVGSPGTSTSTPKASGKGKATPGNGKSTAAVKSKGLRIAREHYRKGEWDIFKVSDVLTKDYGYTPEELGAPEVLDAFNLFPGEMEVPN